MASVSISSAGRLPIRWITFALGVRDDIGLADRRAALRDADHRREPGERDADQRALHRVGVVELEHRRARGDRAEHRHEAERVVKLAEERRRIAAHRVRQHERAAALGDGRADTPGELGAEIALLALALERERRRDQALAAHREDRDGQIVLDFAPLGEDAGPAAAQHDGRAGHAADGVQRLVGTRVRVAGDEDQREVGVIGSAPLEGFERGLERGVVGRAADGDPRSRGDHAWTLTSLLLHFLAPWASGSRRSTRSPTRRSRAIPPRCACCRRLGTRAGCRAWRAR